MAGGSLHARLLGSGEVRRPGLSQARGWSGDNALESLRGVSLGFRGAEGNPSGTGLVGPEEAGVMGGDHGEGTGWGLRRAWARTQNRARLGGRGLPWEAQASRG